MRFHCRPSKLTGQVLIPGSKSHTIRGLAIAALAAGESILENPLTAADTISARQAITAFGATVEVQPGQWKIHGCGPTPQPRRPTIDVGNSGTTLNILMSTAALLEPGQSIDFTGDRQIRRRPAGPLLQALRELGARAVSHQANDCAPLTVGGRLRGGHTSLHANTSQYLTSLLLACPLADHETTIEVPLLYEAPYAVMTLDWLHRQGIQVEYTPQMNRFQIAGQQSYTPFTRAIPADFSSATFFLVAGALGQNRTTCTGLDLEDSQGDKAVVDYLRAMGAKVTVNQHRIQVEAQPLRGIEIDLNNTPDALPAMAVLACFASGETRLVNVPQARIKETDRISVIAAELRKMGADLDELEDGLVIRESRLRGASLNGHGDHRVVMALALAGLSCPGETIVHSAESAAVTFPEFANLMGSLGGDLEIAG